MNNNIFINEFISNGFEATIKKVNGYIFERHIIECLCDIYGKEKLISLYENRDTVNFEKLILSYKLPKNVYENFLFNIQKYEKENAYKFGTKTVLTSFLEENIILMFLYKSLKNRPTIEELSHFENDLLNDFSVIKFHYLVTVSPNKAREVWNKKKKLLSSNVVMQEIFPEYLDEFTYARFGIKLSDIKQMDIKMVNKINEVIKTKISDENHSEGTGKKKKTSILTNTAISSGNGFVDALLIMGVIATEFSIGLIYLFLHV